MNTSTLLQDEQRQTVRARYGAMAEAGAACGPESCCGGTDTKAYAAALGYSSDELAAAPTGANLNLGCGNPLAIASIQPGETVLDLGSGAGFDAFLAARQLAGTGRVIGVDMTPAMVSKARRNAAGAGLANVEFRLGEIEALPVADATIDLVISNCVINLSPDKPAVYREAFRVLRAGGRVAISDVIALQPLPPEWRNQADRLTGCIAGAETVETVRRGLAEAGFVGIRITPRKESREFIEKWEPGQGLGDYIASAVIEAQKPPAA